jgi:hypothetical protein
MCTAKKLEKEEDLECKEKFSEDKKECKLKAADYAKLLKGCTTTKDEADKDCPKEDPLVC